MTDCVLRIRKPRPQSIHPAKRPFFRENVLINPRHHRPHVSTLTTVSMITTQWLFLDRIHSCGARRGHLIDRSVQIDRRIRSEEVQSIPAPSNSEKPAEIVTTVCSIYKRPQIQLSASPIGEIIVMKICFIMIQK